MAPRPKRAAPPWRCRTCRSLGLISPLFTFPLKHLNLPFSISCCLKVLNFPTCRLLELVLAGYFSWWLENLRWSSRFTTVEDKDIMVMIKDNDAKTSKRTTTRMVYLRRAHASPTRMARRRRTTRTITGTSDIDQVSTSGCFVSRQ